MPSGFQNRFTYSDTRIRSFGNTATGATWDWSGAPLIGYEAVFGYRSGKRAKELSQAGKYESLVRSGSLADQIRKRYEYLNNEIKETLTPTSGATGVFQCTGDTGHPFASYKVRSYGNPMLLTYKSSTSNITADVNLSEYTPFPLDLDPTGLFSVKGNIFRRHTYFQWPSTGGYLSSSAPSLSNQIYSNAVKNSLSSGLIASANPWKPKATLAQTILELMSGDIPTVFKNLRKYIYQLQSIKRAAGSDWLNIQFGWVPLANDIRATVEVLMKLHMLLYADDQAYRRTRGGDLGSWSRLFETPYSRVLTTGSPLNSSTTSDPFVKDAQGITPRSSPPPIGAGVGAWSLSTRITADFRFSAKYHRGARPNSQERGYLERAMELLGLEVTPAVLWELTPWTWLLDWATNLGSVASNITMLNWSNVLLDYAYLTCVVKTTSSVSVKLSSSLISANTTVNGTYFGLGFESIEKVREQASPFGFSVSWDGLNPFQLSILAALGMSRGR